MRWTRNTNKKRRALRARRFLFVFLVQRALISTCGEKKTNKKIQENAYLRTSRCGQVLFSTVAEKETDCSAQNNSNMETDGEGKFVSFKFVLGGTPLVQMNHGAVSIAWFVAFIGAQK